MAAKEALAFDRRGYAGFMHAMLRSGPILLIAACTLFAQQDATIRVDVQQVLVPVVVTDKNGHHVGGLRGPDFQIFEDGVRQDVASFSTETAGSVDDVGALSKPAQAGPRHTFVICIDTLHASPANATRTRQALEGLFEKEKSAGAQYVLIGIGRQLQVLQAATDNPLAILLKLRSAALQSAMRGLDGSALSAQLQNTRSRMEELCKRCACGTQRSLRNCDSEIDVLKQSVDAEAERWTAPTAAVLEQFRRVVEELAKLPTGRTLILVSDGFNVNPKLEFYAIVSAYLPGRPQFKPDSVNMEPDLREALKVASERNVTIYAVDSRGRSASGIGSAGSMDASASGGTGSGSSILGTNRPAAPTRTTAPLQSGASPQSGSLTFDESGTMEQLARSTGGVYFHGGDMLKQFRGALTDGREYYVLAYVPKNSAHDGTFRSITVETSNKKLSVRAKSGYWAAGAAQ
jgi:VWFA-related protein